MKKLQPNRKFMERAIKEALVAQREGDYAVGAVLVKGNRIIAACSNKSKRDESPIAHAEALAILKGSKILKSRHLEGCILYSTHEPCPMCASLVVWSRLSGIVYGARIRDMDYYSRKHANKNYLWRTIGISCEEILNSSHEKIALVKDFMRRDCVELFHNK